VTVPISEQAVATLVVTRGDGTGYATRVTDGEVATDALAQAVSVATSLVRLRPEVTVAVTGNAEARLQHARRRDQFWLLGQKPCTCPKTYPLVSQSYRAGEKARPLVQDITDPQRDCPHLRGPADRADVLTDCAGSRLRVARLATWRRRT
jgi:hypothetical protein